jgi:Holliday junction resolvase RusA-like endonuclease
MKLTIPYEPTPKGVPRTRFFNGKAITYYHKNTVAALEAIRTMVHAMHLKPFPVHVPIAMTVTFYRTRPRWGLKREFLPVRKPDLDNFLKLTLDTITEMAVPDDAQICVLHAYKVWSDNGSGRIEIDLQEIKKDA